MKIIGFTEEYSDQLNDLSDTLFGKGYLSSKSLNEPNSFILLAVEGQQLIGFTVAKIIDAGSTNPKGVMDMIGVHPDYQKKGVGKVLFNKRWEELNNRGVYNFVLYHWVTVNNPKPKLAIANGFKLIASHPEYWKNMSIKGNYPCAECGPPPCSCTCDEYTFKL